MAGIHLVTTTTRPQTPAKECLIKVVAIPLVATIHQRLVRHLVRKAVVVDSAVRRPVQTTRTPDRVDPLLPDGAVDHQDLQDHTAVVLAMRVVPVATALVTVATTVQMPVVDLLVHQLAVVQVDPTVIVDLLRRKQQRQQLRLRPLLAVHIVGGVAVTRRDRELLAIRRFNCRNNRFRYRVCQCRPQHRRRLRRLLQEAEIVAAVRHPLQFHPRRSHMIIRVLPRTTRPKVEAECLRLELADIRLEA